MENTTAIEAEAFAELVRKLSIDIIGKLNAERYEQAMSAANSLLGAALDRKREFQATATRSDPDRFDLSALAIDPNAPNDEAEGLNYD